jgi:opacity protein-like surface antigen
MAAKDGTGESGMKALKRRLASTGVFVLLALYATSGAAQGLRAGKWEFTIQGQFTDSQDISSDNGSRATIDSAFHFGLGLAYNFNDHFSLGGEVVWGEADYSATVTPDAAGGNTGAPFTVSGNLDTNTVRVNAAWNFLASALTPFVIGGIGATWVDTNVPDGPPSTECWWDPWWGYYCGTSVPTKDDTYLSYMAGVGVRWDYERTVFVRGLAAIQWIDVGGGLGTLDVTQYRIDIGFRF